MGASIAATGVSNKTVLRVRQVLAAVFYFGMRPGQATEDGTPIKLTSNPVRFADVYEPDPPRPRIFCKPREVEAIARVFEAGGYRARKERTDWQEADDRRDADAIRLSGYLGLRLGELLELRWNDINVDGDSVTISRSLSAGVERDGTKAGYYRTCGLPKQAADALARLRKRPHFTSEDDLIVCSAIGRKIDESSLRKRYHRAQNIAGVDPLRLHDLRHSFGSNLAAAGVDIVSIQNAMGHQHLETTKIYMHAKPPAASIERARLPRRPPSARTDCAGCGGHPRDLAPRR